MPNSDRSQEQEGVIKFQQRYVRTDLPSYDLSGLDGWRNVLYRLKLIGQDSARYGGAGFGNVSRRVGSSDESRRKRKFVITGTQTGGTEKLTRGHYTTVLEYDFEKNLVLVEGPIEASSESMTHGMVYDQDGSVKYVFHVHSPEVWRASDKLCLPATRRDVEYGTPEMAEEVRRLFIDTDVSKRKIFSMAGHEDGIVGFGRTAEEAGLILVKTLAEALSLA